MSTPLPNDIVRTIASMAPQEFLFSSKDIHEVAMSYYPLEFTYKRPSIVLGLPLECMKIYTNSITVLQRMYECGDYKSMEVRLRKLSATYDIIEYEMFLLLLYLHTQKYRNDETVTFELWDRFSSIYNSYYKDLNYTINWYNHTVNFLNLDVMTKFAKLKSLSTLIARYNLIYHIDVMLSTDASSVRDNSDILNIFQSLPFSDDIIMIIQQTNGTDCLSNLYTDVFIQNQLVTALNSPQNCHKLWHIIEALKRFGNMNLDLSPLWRIPPDQIRISSFFRYLAPLLHRQSPITTIHPDMFGTMYLQRHDTVSMLSFLRAHNMELFEKVIKDHINHPAVLAAVAHSFPDNFRSIPTEVIANAIHNGTSRTIQEYSKY